MKKTIIIISILIVIGILGFIAYNSVASKVSQAFIDKHNETVALGKDAEQLSDLTNMPEMDALDKQISSGDYGEALKSIDAAIGRKKEASSKLDSIDSKILELKALSAKISDAQIKTSTDKFLDIYQKANSAKNNYINLQMKLFESTKGIVSILVKNPKAVSAADEKVANDLVKQKDDIGNQIDNAKKEMDDIQSQYKEAEKEFFKLVNLEVAK